MVGLPQKLVLFQKERELLSQELRDYRKLGLAVLAGSGTIFFGLMFIYARIFLVNINELPLAEREVFRTLVWIIPVMGFFAQLPQVRYIVSIKLHTQTLAQQLEYVTWKLGTPHSDIWHTLDVERPKYKVVYLWKFVEALIPLILIEGVWMYLLWVVVSVRYL